MAADYQYNNPLLEDFLFPPYDAIQPKHVSPAILSLLDQLESNLVELETRGEPTWPKLVEPLEKIKDRLSVVWGIVNHLNAVMDSPELRSAIEEVQPEKLRFASVDLELHKNYIPGGLESVFDIDQRVSRKTQVMPLQPEDRFLCSFSHIFADTYAAGYYCYQWAEVLAADAFSAFEEAGLNNEKAVKETGIKFRETVLALGGGKSPLQVFIDFRGREPSPEPLRRYYGLKPALAVS
uniref:Peptidase M3A/M3B catalytic domain-containing protein n=1 Tax=Populus trichocarpa TaxID=3694 RepID=A0A3N7FNQ3_POPTR|eukprot:XP_024464083.1 probable cytosolic oligopeptidase A isoform X2 [Populus trichocarpa]